ncbi:hypothetical protein AUEXF2481DRAFT_42376 [Aureobasidium subglaciale EXF-2481]|uniref:Carbonyl reductase n=1 Tax=Aureobasidium subglaciale (strain EXF-2481) TaxID=1043005 RepID=A0A074Z285_AURSE|nr:uncharacterized protein AUEXF2481DRAFT_42376 [Aureobasidium subglaciale EXF-2481]KAI5229121.1 hypothetical protein E4T41_03589 [Aureobasidium subglaciale]KEQ93146.1 hypothetical protein AUEXF2481DRAFT_42376 [Aureobasidium subglaciale EXF-2481]
MSGNIVLISGANQGIGFEIAKQLSVIPNYHVLLGSRGLEKGESAVLQIKNVGGSVEAIQLDITDGQSITAARDLVETKYGRLDVLINNAAILLDFQVNADYTLGQAMQDTFATNTSGAANLVETFLPLLKLSAVPRVVFVSSTVGSLHTFADFKPSYTMTKYFAPAYACSKAALNMLMLLYNVQYQEKGWKINACCPGFRQTNFCDYDDKAGPVEEGASVAIELATLGKDGQSGTFVNMKGAIPW